MSNKKNHINHLKHVLSPLWFNILMNEIIKKILQCNGNQMILMIMITYVDVAEYEEDLMKQYVEKKRQFQVHRPKTVETKQLLQKTYTCTLKGCRKNVRASNGRIMRMISNRLVGIDALVLGSKRDDRE